MKRIVFSIILVLYFLTGYSQGYPVSFQLPDTAFVKAGDTFSVAASFSTNAPWYIYAPTGNNASQGMIETTIIFQLPKGITRKGQLQLPKAKRKGEFEVFEGNDIKFLQEFTVSKELQPGAYSIHAKVTYQTCNEKICLPPVSEERVIVVVVGAKSGNRSLGSEVGEKPAEDTAKRTESTGEAEKLSLQFTALDGRKVDLEKLKGKLVLIDCWATWCRPCIAEFSNVKAMYDKYRKLGFEVIGISMDEEAAKQRVKDLIIKNKLPWPQGFEGKGFDDNSFVKQQNIASLPTVLLIDKNGNIVDRDARGERLEELIKKYLAVE